MATPKAVPYLTVGFGTRPQRLRVPATAKPYKPPTPEQRYRAMSKVVVAPLPNASPAQRPKEIPVGETPPGRPVSNIGQYLIKPIDDTNSGFEMVNTEPKTIQQVNEQYMRKGQLPTALQPKYLRKPEVLEQGRRKNISRGWRKPRSRAG